MKKKEMTGSMMDQDATEAENGQFDAVVEIEDADVDKVAGGLEKDELMCGYMDS